MDIRLGLLLAVAIAAPAFAQAVPPAPNVRPLRGQSAEQTQIDVAQCRNVASEATGFVPGTAAALPVAAEPAAGGRARGAVVGLGVGAIVGEAGAGAAAGAVAGGMNQRQNRRASAGGQQRAAAAQSQRATAWTNANVGCLQSRGFAVEKPPVAWPVK